ncbi:MAG: hypothetical protein ACXWHZ_03620 [Usitatibacter sp.]
MTPQKNPQDFETQDQRLDDTKMKISSMQSAEAGAGDPPLDPDMPPGAKQDIADAFESDLEESEEAQEEQGEGKSEEEAEVDERKLILDALGSHLQRQVNERVNQRRPIEDRWLEDLRQYHAKYDPKLLADIEAAKGSKVFVNITAPKTDGFSARMADMILPTNGKNWGMKNTPVPEVMNALHDTSPLMVNGQPMTTASGAHVQVGDVAKGVNAVLAERCKSMEQEMDDQLTECGYNAAQRRAIDQVSQLGTMVLKGPSIIGRTRRAWMKVSDATGTVHVAQIIEDKRPAVEFVDLWDFFPDLNSPDPEGWEDAFQRHYMTKRQLRALADQPGFDKDAIREVLKEDRRPYATALHLQMLRDITGEHQTTSLLSRYELWEYHGPVTAEQLAACGVEMSDEDYDPLAVMDAIVWFCEGKVLKAVPNTTKGLGYHVTWVKKDETSPFGFGIPRLMRNSQKVANAAWRMVMDNAGLALSPQIIMAMGVIPADGNWTMYPGKIWIAKEGIVDVRYAMQTFDMPIRLKELLSIFETAVKLADEETSMPIIMQGDRGPAIPETAEGMSMLFNAASVVQRRFVRLYDDRITTPIITALYDWNMEFNEKEDIKGDYECVALGSSALLEKERHAQNVLAALNLCASPIISPRVDIHGIVEEAFKSLGLGDKVKDRKEADAEVQRQTQQAQQAAAAQAGGKGGAAPNPQLEQAKIAIAEREVAAREKSIEVLAETDAQKLALKREELALKERTGADANMTKIATAKFKEDATNARFNAEIAHANAAGQGI